MERAWRRRHMPPTLSDRELWACANEVLRQYGDEAPVRVAERIGALALAGDAAGVEVWWGIARRLEQLSRSPAAPNSASPETRSETN